MESPIDAARASMENARAAEVVGRFGSLDLYRQSSLSPPFQAVYTDRPVLGSEFLSGVVHRLHISSLT
jgi:hypothetical protein